MTRHEVPARALVVFFALQALDVITTLLGFRAGAHEANFVVAWFLHLGPMTGLLVAKLAGVLLAVTVFLRGKTRMIRLLNMWCAGVVTWNLIMVWMQHFRNG